MTMSLVVDGKEHIPLSSNLGWSKLQEWARLLDPKLYGEVIHLAEYGVSQDVPALQDQLAAALEKAKPFSVAVTHTVSSLRESLSQTKSAGCVFVSNGLSDESGDATNDEDHWQGGDGNLSDEDRDAYLDEAQA